MVAQNQAGKTGKLIGTVSVRGSSREGEPLRMIWNKMLIARGIRSLKRACICIWWWVSVVGNQKEQLNMN